MYTVILWNKMKLLFGLKTVLNMKEAAKHDPISKSLFLKYFFLCVFHLEKALKSLILEVQ